MVLYCLPSLRTHWPHACATFKGLHLNVLATDTIKAFRCILTALRKHTVDYCPHMVQTYS